MTEVIERLHRLQTRYRRLTALEMRCFVMRVVQIGVANFDILQTDSLRSLLPGKVSLSGTG